MVALLTMTGGASLVSVWLYKRQGDKKQLPRTHRAKQSWWQAPWKGLQVGTPESIPAVAANGPPRPAVAAVADLSMAASKASIDEHTVIDYGLRTSSLAAAVTTAGTIFYPPLQVAGLPLLIYMGIPSAQEAYDQLWVDGRPSRALGETVVLAVCLAGGFYWVGSLGFWLYYGGRRLLAEKPQINVIQQSEWSLPAMTHLWQDGTASEVETATLQPGDQVIIRSGEMAAVEGVITEGAAWLRPQAVLPGVSGLRKGVGDSVAATDIVLVGRICVQVI